MMKNTRKILFPAVAAVSMMGSGFATSLITVMNADGTLPIVDTAVTNGQIIQLAAGGTIIEGAAGVAVGTVTVNVIGNGKKSHCTFILSTAFGGTALAPLPAATVAAKGNCANTALHFVQKGTAAPNTCTVRLSGVLGTLYYYSPNSPGTKLIFCSDAAGTETLTPNTSADAVPPVLRGCQVPSVIADLVYLKNADDLDQLSIHIKGTGVVKVDKDAATLTTALKALFNDNRV